jgi:hypothetical protein
MKLFFNLWPPFWILGIRIQSIAPDYKHIKVILKMHWYNRNYVGTHFGGGMYAMTDPWYMIMLIQLLGPRFIVWDHSAAIRFKKPGKGTLRAEFTVTEQELAHIHRELEHESTFLWSKDVNVLNQAGETVAIIQKTIYIRPKHTSTV